MNKPGIHRTTPNTKRGRSIISPGLTHEPSRIGQETWLHNKAVDDAKAAKKAMKKMVKQHHV
jgi:hypothetical protein